MPSKYIKDIFIVSVTFPPPSSSPTLPVLLQAAVYFKGALAEQFKQKKALKHTKGLPLFFRNDIGITWLFPSPQYLSGIVTSHPLTSAQLGRGMGELRQKAVKPAFNYVCNAFTNS